MQRMINKVKRTFLILLTPIQKIMQKIGRKEPLMTYDQTLEIISLAKEGDILLSYESQRLTSSFIKGYYKHAAIISSKMTVVEAVGTGVREVELIEWILDKDSVALIRPLYDSNIINKQAAATSLYYLGFGYDFSFSLVDQRVYCSELIYLCYYKNDAKFLEHLDHNDILPNEYYEACFLDNSNLKLIKQFKNI
jgi:uncharacterized protein YycO